MVCRPLVLGVPDLELITTAHTAEAGFLTASFRLAMKVSRATMAPPRATHDGTLPQSTFAAITDETVAPPSCCKIHIEAFVRIGSIAKAGDDELWDIDLHDPKVRAAVRAFDGGQVSIQYEFDTARPYR